MRKPKKSDIPENGCFTASVAYLFGIPIKKAPQLQRRISSGAAQDQMLKNWCDRRGYRVILLRNFAWKSTRPIKLVSDLNVPFIAAGPSLANPTVYHALVMKGTKIIFNNDAELEYITDIYLFWPKKLTLPRN